MMKSKSYLVALMFLSFTISFCTQENKKEVVVKTSDVSETVEKSKSKGKCCASIPARFSIKRSNIPQPESRN